MKYFISYAYQAYNERDWHFGNSIIETAEVLELFKDWEEIERFEMKVRDKTPMKKLRILYWKRLF